MKKMPVVLCLVIIIATISCGSLIHDHKWVFHNSASHTVTVYPSSAADFEAFSLEPGERNTVWSSRTPYFRHSPLSTVDYVEKTKTRGRGYDFEVHGAVVFYDKGKRYKK